MRTSDIFPFTFALYDKNILFDFGGVFYDLDFSKTSDAFKQLGFSDFDDVFTQYQADALFQQLETGSISPEAFFYQDPVFATCSGDPRTNTRCLECAVARL
ncbi:hypothetical protein KRR40_14410 [Niabella defluvii]|nr:hypothetical protein KRR40_14410 [Niabella sp. I65]